MVGFSRETEWVGFSLKGQKQNPEPNDAVVWVGGQHQKGSEVQGVRTRLSGV